MSGGGRPAFPLRRDTRGVGIFGPEVIAVAMPVTGPPPHRSQRAQFAHWAPTSADTDGKAALRPRTVLDHGITHPAWRFCAERPRWVEAGSFHDADHGPIDKVGSIALCNPRYASRILADANNRKVTAFMPLAIGVYEDGKGQVYVSQLDVGLMGMMFGGTIAEVMGVAGKDLNAVVATAVGK